MEISPLSLEEVEMLQRGLEAIDASKFTNANAQTLMELQAKLVDALEEVE